MTTTSAAAARRLALAKTFALIGFLCLVVCTYFLRSEVLALSHIKFTADELRASHELARLRDAFPDRQAQYEASMRYYEIQMEHYRTMLNLYESDYDEYVQRLDDKYTPPALPTVPQPPADPKFSEQLYQIKADFRARKNRYFSMSSRLNWFACIAALMLAGGLLFLMLFDEASQRWHYLVALVISFVFLIGPAFHSILSGVIGFLEEPRAY